MAHGLLAHRPRQAVRIGITIAAVVLVLATALSRAAAAEERPAARNAGEFIRAIGDEVITVLKAHGDDRERRKRRLQGVFVKAFDVDAMAQFAAGRHWRQAAPVERAEYRKLFENYVAAMYADKFADYSGQTFEIARERSLEDGASAVEAAIVSPQKPPVRLDFRVRRSNGTFRIFDVYLAGLSLLITKRDEFAAILARHGMSGLNERLRSSVGS